MPDSARGVARAPRRGHRPVHPAGARVRRRSTRAPACRPGSRSRPPRPSPPPPCAAAAIDRRGASRWPGCATCRRSCPTLRGKVEFEVSEEGREPRCSRTCCAGPRPRRSGRRLGGADLSALRRPVRRGRPGRVRRPGPGRRAAAPIGPVQRPGADHVAARHGRGRGVAGHAAAALEFALEGLYLMRRLSKDDVDGVDRLPDVTADGFCDRTRSLIHVRSWRPH